LNGQRRHHSRDGWGGHANNPVFPGIQHERGWRVGITGGHRIPAAVSVGGLFDAIHYPTIPEYANSPGN
jgi:hypothetical protein